MIITADRVLCYWFEDEKGNMYDNFDSSLPVTYEESMGSRKLQDLLKNTPQIKYRCFYEPPYTIVYEEVLRYDKIQSCDHPKESIIRHLDPDYLCELKQCSKCGGTKVCDPITNEWGRSWVLGDPLISFRKEVIVKREDEIILPELMGLVKSHSYYGNYIAGVLPVTMLIMHRACNRCKNTLKHSAGLGGFSEGSDEWKNSTDICVFCKEDTIAEEKPRKNWNTL